VLFLGVFKKNVTYVSAISWVEPDEKGILRICLNHGKQKKYLGRIWANAFAPLSLSTRLFLAFQRLGRNKRRGVPKFIWRTSNSTPITAFQIWPDAFLLKTQFYGL
jgi:hypothetical protein